MDDAARLLVRLDSDKARHRIAKRYFVFGERVANHVGRPIECLQALPSLLLPTVIVGDGKGHQVLERDLFLAVERDEPRADVRELQAPLDDCGSDTEPCSDILDALARIDELAKRLELVCRVHRFPSRVLDKADLHGPLVAHDETRHRVVGRDASLLDQALQRAPAPAAGNDCVSGVRLALTLRTLIDIEVLQDALSVDELGELLDAGLAGGLANVDG